MRAREAAQETSSPARSAPLQAAPRSQASARVAASRPASAPPPDKPVQQKTAAGDTVQIHTGPENPTVSAMTSALGADLAPTPQQQLDTYWKDVQAARERGEYVKEHPPVVPPAPPSAAPAPPPARPIPTKETFLQSARDVYGFTPEAASEGEFKANYAREASRLGVTKEQLAGVYAFETGGNGRHDLQPMKKDGVTPLSTALGYAQLLNATSVDMVARHGVDFATQLEAAGKADKAAVVRRMTADAQGVPAKFSAYQEFARTPAGRAMHALNLDKDLGPLMQARHLAGTVEAGGRAGRPHMSPAQLELLNLAGTKNGLAMLNPELSGLPTANFFDRAGYEANPVVKGRSGEELLGRIQELMTQFSREPGTQELLQAWPTP